MSRFFYTDTKTPPVIPNFKFWVLNGTRRESEVVEDQNIHREERWRRRATT